MLSPCECAFSRLSCSLRVVVASFPPTASDVTGATSSSWRPSRLERAPVALQRAARPRSLEAAERSQKEAPGAWTGAPGERLRGATVACRRAALVTRPLGVTKADRPPRAPQLAPEQSLPRAGLPAREERRGAVALAVPQRAVLPRSERAAGSSTTSAAPRQSTGSATASVPAPSVRATGATHGRLPQPGSGAARRGTEGPFCRAATRTQSAPCAPVTTRIRSAAATTFRPRLC